MINLKNKNFLLNNLMSKISFINLIVIISIFFSDRYTKNLIINSQEIKDKIKFINDYVNLELMWNTGIGFGLLSLVVSWIYHSISLVIFIIIGILIYLVFISSIKDKILISFIIGGGLGNLYDRISYYAVPDFIDIHYKNFHWFTFNLADIFISIGIIAILLKDLISKK